MQQPVQLKVFFGAMLVTRRMYLFLSAGGFLLLALIGLGYCTVYSPSSWLGGIIMSEGPWFYDILPWLLGGAAVLEIIEVVIVLRRLREREEFLKRERGLGASEANHRSLE